MELLYTVLYSVLPALSCPSLSSVSIGFVRAFSSSSLIFLESVKYEFNALKMAFTYVDVQEFSKSPEPKR